MVEYLLIFGFSVLGLPLGFALVFLSQVPHRTIRWIRDYLGIKPFKGQHIIQLSLNLPSQKESFRTRRRFFNRVRDWRMALTWRIWR